MTIWHQGRFPNKKFFSHQTSENQPINSALSSQLRLASPTVAKLTRKFGGSSGSNQLNILFRFWTHPESTGPTPTKYLFPTFPHAPTLPVVFLGLLDPSAPPPALNDRAVDLFRHLAEQVRQNLWGVGSSCQVDVLPNSFSCPSGNTVPTLTLVA
jgi:hypothetical protein